MKRNIWQVAFTNALASSAKLITHRKRLIQLLIQVGMRLRKLESRRELTDLVSRVKTLTRLIHASATGAYKAPWKLVVYGTAALIYFVVPTDAIPDLIPAGGFVDDISVMLWVYNTMSAEIERFQVWESTTVNG